MAQALKSVALISVFFLICSGAAGQVVMGIGDDNAEARSSAGRQRFRYEAVRGTVIDSATREPVAGALVSILAPNMPVRHASTGHKGEFAFRGDIAKEGLKIEITMMGYRIYAAYPDATTRILDLGKIRMSLDAKEIDAITVKGRLAFFTIKGDTILFNPRAARVLQDATAADILRKMPGVEVEGDRITVMGESVARTYVNGRLIYGAGNRGVHHVGASAVEGIQSYDEVDAEHYLVTGEIKKRRVINVLTFDLFSQDITADAFVGYGADLSAGPEGKRQDRYAGGGGASSFSEGRQVALDATFGNIPIDRQVGSGMMTGSRSRGNEGYRRETAVKAEYNRNVMKMKDIPQPDGRIHRQNVSLGGLMVNYSYRNEYDRNERRSDMAYFPAAAYTSRSDNSISQSFTSSNAHALNIDFNSLNMKLSPRFSLSGSLADSRSGGMLNQLVVQDGEKINDYRSETGRKGREGRFIAGANIRVPFGKRQQMEIGGVVDYGRGNSDGWQVDSLSGTSVKTTLETRAPGNDNLNLRGETAYTFELPKNNRLSLKYALDYRKGRIHSVTADAFTGVVDTTLTRDYAENTLDHRVLVQWNRYFKNGTTLMVSAGANLSSVGRDERFPGPAIYDKLFVTPEVSVMLNRYKAFNSLSFDYRLFGRTPSVSDIGSRIDAFNPLLLQAGNPGLKSELHHNVRFGVNRSRNQRVWSFNMGFSAVQNAQVMRRRWFAQEEYLPQYDYLAREGASLTDRMNLPGMWDAFAGVSYDTPVNPLKSKARIGVRYSYAHAPAMLDGRRESVGTSAAGLNAQLTTNFSAKFEAVVTSETQFRHNVSSSKQVDNAVSEKCGLVFRYNPHPRLFLNSSYDFLFIFSSLLHSSLIRNHLHNATFGYRLLKNKSMNLSVTVYDILDRNNPLVVNVSAFGISESWRQTYSRYFTVNLSWKFSKKK